MRDIAMVVVVSSYGWNAVLAIAHGDWIALMGWLCAIIMGILYTVETWGRL